MRSALIAITISLAVVSACSREAPARADTTSAEVTQVRDSSGSATRRNTPTSIRGDTFLLVAVGSQSTRVPVSDSAPCGFQPYLRLVISDERSFYRVTDTRPTCFGPATDSASHWSGLWSTYRMNGDTLHLFQGDGDETFYWVSGILSDDSLIQLADDKPYRFVSIRPTLLPTHR